MKKETKTETARELSDNELTKVTGGSIEKNELLKSNPTDYDPLKESGKNSNNPIEE